MDWLSMFFLFFLFFYQNWKKKWKKRKKKSNIAENIERHILIYVYHRYAKSLRQLLWGVLWEVFMINYGYEHCCSLHTVHSYRTPERRSTLIGGKHGPSVGGTAHWTWCDLSADLPCRDIKVVRLWLLRKVIRLYMKGIIFVHAKHTPL